MLPSFYPSLTTPDSNLASGLEATPIHYMAADGTSLGYGNRCAGLGCYAGRPCAACSGGLNAFSEGGYFDTVKGLANWKSEWGVAILSAAHGYRRRGNLLSALAWGLAGYVAPLPTAAAVFTNEAGIELLPQAWR